MYTPIPLEIKHKTTTAAIMRIMYFLKKKKSRNLCYDPWWQVFDTKLFIGAAIVHDFPRIRRTVPPGIRNPTATHHAQIERPVIATQSDFVETVTSLISRSLGRSGSVPTTFQGRTSTGWEEG
jgi:hypothetical protein